LIEVKDLTKRYGDFLAVDHLSFTVEDGQIYGFLGPNGAGKSTTMNMITGYLAPTEGEVLVNGHSMLEEPEEAKRTIGFLPEIPPVYPDMTVKEYLDFACALKKVKKSERAEQVAQAMEELSITDVSGRLIRNLSKGYRQRVGFAQALLGNPQTLILDEPTVGLDPRQIIEIRDLIKRLGERHTVILSSHILSEVSEVCDQVLIISKGRLVACDAPENLGKSDGETATLTLTCAGTKEQAEAVLSEVLPESTPEITTDAEGLIHVSVSVPGDTDPRSTVSKALFDAQCMIYEMHLEQASLENIFLELTESAAEEDAAEVAAETAEDAVGEAAEAAEAVTETAAEEVEEAVDKAGEEADA